MSHVIQGELVIFNPSQNNGSIYNIIHTLAGKKCHIVYTLTLTPNCKLQLLCLHGEKLQRYLIIACGDEGIHICSSHFRAAFYN